MSDDLLAERRRRGGAHVYGDDRIEVADGTLIREDTRVALCRCGGSANKSFCDGTHRRIGFQTPPEPRSVLKSVQRRGVEQSGSSPGS